MRRIGFGLVVLVLLVMTACKPETTIKDTIINENNNETIEGEQGEKTMTEIVTKAWILEQYMLSASVICVGASILCSGKISHIAINSKIYTVGEKSLLV